MQFHEYPDSLPIFRTLLPRATRDTMYHLLGTLNLDPIATAHLDWEARWHRSRRPYYRVWPKIMPMLLGLDLAKVESRFAQLPIPELLIQLPVGNPLGLHVIMAANCATPNGPGIIIGSMDGKAHPKYGMPLVDIWVFEASSQSILENLDGLKQSAPLEADKATRNRVVSLVTTLCLLGDNPELISPAILAKDEGSTRDLTGLVEKARRRGKIGWEVGRGIEVAPHIRRPHPALVWTGEGRTVPKIVLRKGSVVHRSAIDSLPTGYQDDT